MQDKSPLARLSCKTLLVPLALLCAIIPLHFSRALTIQLVTTFDYPGASSTTPTGINDRGEVSGVFIKSNQIHGFIRNRDGSFRPPLIEPNDNTDDTEAMGINNSRLVCGFYRHSYLGEYAHGFLFSGNTYTEFDIPGARETWIYGINDTGDFVGTSENEGGTLFSGFVNTAGTTTTFFVNASYWTSPRAINAAGETVGYFLDDRTNAHGFFRDASGALVFPLDVPDVQETFLLDLNDSDQFVGNYEIAYRNIHGLLMNVSGSFITYDYPGAEITSLNGINNAGLICGSYAGRQNHGFIARVTK